MSDKAYDDEANVSPRERYSPGVDLPRRRSVPPLAIFILIVVALLLVGMSVGNWVNTHLSVSTEEGQPKTSASLTQLGGAPPITWPDGDNKPPADAKPSSPPPATAPAGNKSAYREAADYAKRQFGGGESRSVLTVPKDWDKPTNPTGPQIAQQYQPTDADRAAAAFGQRPTRPNVASTSATVVGDRTRTIRPGTKVFCTTMDAIDTSTGEGAFTCDVDDPIPAWDGMTPLIPAHSWITAHYKELKSGRNRIFASSGLLTGPDGLVVDLGDPFTMPDGSSGVEGHVIDNTWARIKEGVILDFISSAFQAGVSAASQGNGNTYLNLQTNNTQGALSQNMQREQIPDVLWLPQGSHLTVTIQHPIFVQDAVKFELRAGQ
jgi:type IV secretory pathway VirB10-like protein